MPPFCVMEIKLLVEIPLLLIRFISKYHLSKLVLIWSFVDGYKLVLYFKISNDSTCQYCSQSIHILQKRLLHFRTLSNKSHNHLLTYKNRKQIRDKNNKNIFSIVFFDKRNKPFQNYLYFCHVR